MQVLLVGKKYSRTVGIWTMEYIYSTILEGTAGALLFSETLPCLHLDALDLYGMVFKGFIRIGCTVVIT